MTGQEREALRQAGGSESLKSGRGNRMVKNCSQTWTETADHMATTSSRMFTLLTDVGS